MLHSLSFVLGVLPLKVFLLSSFYARHVYAVDAGVGMEFEAGGVMFEHKDCSPKDTLASSQKPVKGHTGSNWALTGDTTDDPCRLTIEYILDGKTIKLGEKRLKTAAKEAADDYVNWSPGKDMDPNEWEIEGAPSNPWRIVLPDSQDEACEKTFSTQVTAPVPLEAIYDYFEFCITAPITETWPLAPSTDAARRGQNGQQKQKVWVKNEFFQASPAAFQSNDKDVQGFFSLVLTYIKGGTQLAVHEDSPKELSTLMPRTDFSTMYALVKDKIPSDRLYDIIKILACYNNVLGGTGVVLDNEYCTGELDDPKPNNKLDGQVYSISDPTKKPEPCVFTVPGWIESIRSGGPDLLSKADAECFKGSVGGLGKALERMLGSDREVPIFEFRGLKAKTADQWETFAEEVERELIRIHDKHK